MSQTTTIELGSTALKCLYAGYSTYLAMQPNLQKKCFDLGSTVDALLCQSGDVFDRIFIRPQLDSNGKEFARSNEGKTVLQHNRNLGKACISQDEFQQAEAIANAVQSHPIASMFFDKANANLAYQVELKSATTLGNRQSVTLRALPDVVLKNSVGQVIAWVDLKTTSRNTHADFIRQFGELNYDIQAALYTQVMADCGVTRFATKGKLFDLFDYPVLYIGVATTAPYSVFVTELSEEVINTGLNKISKALDNLSDGLSKQAAGQYVGYCEIVKIGGVDSKKTVQAINTAGDLF